MFLVIHVTFNLSEFLTAIPNTKEKFLELIKYTHIITIIAFNKSVYTQIKKK